MSISPQHARHALDTIEEITQRTRTMSANAPGDKLYFLWGAIWIAGFAGTYIAQSRSGWLWLVLIALGIAGSMYLGRTNTPVRSAADKRLGWRIGVFWWALFAYAGLWFALLSPFLSVTGQEQSQQFWRHMGLIYATLPMFAYVTMGLLFNNLMVWTGLLITVLACIGLLFGPFFWLWMAFAGGGTLIATGWYIRVRWA